MIFHPTHPRLAPFSVFVNRLAKYFGFSILLILGALCIGILGYHLIAGFGWVDSLLEASMILGGMGPVNQLPNDGAKIFASIYALFSGLIFIGVMSLILSPIVHRMLHKFHLDDSEAQSD